MKKSAIYSVSITIKIIAATTNYNKITNSSTF